MTANKRIWAAPLHLSICLVLAGASGCAQQQQQTQTLADIDRPTRRTAAAREPTPKTTQAEVKQAYYDYIRGAAQDDPLRVHAATRIAELELAMDQSMHPTETAAAEAQFDRTVRNTIDLLNTTLRDFPNAPGTENTLYQLAKAYDQLGESDQAVAVLERLVADYPDTVHYIEAKFRIAENAFVNGLYFKSEDAYTDVLRARGNRVFTEKALFKRGWARYKQDMYHEALDDFYQAIDQSGLDASGKRNAGEQELFDEYFRAVGLAFSYLGGASAIEEYFRSRDYRAHAYHTYKTVSELLLAQQRYSDAVATYEAYLRYHPRDAQQVKAALEVVNIWKNAGFFTQYSSAFATFYERYHPQAPLWADRSIAIPAADKRAALQAIRDNIVALAAHHHNLYQRQKRAENLAQAQLWYQRYLAGYRAFARQDKIYPLYADLLNRAGELEQALIYYELAAFDGDIVLDKESAYATVFITDQLQRRAGPATRDQWLQKHLEYAFLYAQLYPTESHTPALVQNAVQLSFNAGQRERVIELANILPDSAPQTIVREVSLLKAQAYFDLASFDDAELVYLDLLLNPALRDRERQELSDRLALSIYRQAEAARELGNIEEAARHFLRVRREVPQSELTPTAVYDAIALFMDHQFWDQAIQYLRIFQQEYPRHPFQEDVSKHLSLAYLRADRGLDAAREFERLADYLSSEDEKMAALWQAAELYYTKGELQSALRAYRDYAHTYKRPYPQNMEAMAKLVDIYQTLGDRERRSFWLNAIVQADNRATISVKTDRTEYIAAGAAFALATQRQDEYDQIRLVHPLERSLRNKKAAMQDSVRLFGSAAVYGHEEFVTQSTLRIGDIYHKFAKALMDSERPRDLNQEELEQYDILLEDQAFPFEDKAIEFYETNMTRIAAGTYDAAVRESLLKLKTLFPARYGRAPKLESFVERLN